MCGQFANAFRSGSTGADFTFPIFQCAFQIAGFLIELKFDVVEDLFGLLVI